MAQAASSVQEQLAQAATKLRALKADSSGWTDRESKVESTVVEKIHGQNADGLEIRIAKATITIDAPAKVVFDVIWNHEKEWNGPTVGESRIVDEPVKDKVQVVYHVHKVLSAASAKRDVVFARTFDEAPNSYFIYQTSVESTKAPAPKTGGLTRGKLLYGGFFIEEANAKSTVTYISAFDFGAWLHEKFIEGETIRHAQRLTKIKEKSLQRLPR